MGFDYSRKISHHPVPKFTFPTRPPAQPPVINQETSTKNIIKTINEIVSPFTSTAIDSTTTAADSTILTTSDNVADIINATFTDMVGLIPNTTLTFDEEPSSNSTLINAISESITSSSMIEIMQTSSIPIKVDQNITVLTDTMKNKDTILTTLSEFTTSAAQNTLSVLTTTTEKAMAVNKISASTKTHEHASHHHSYDDSHHWLYVILIVIVAVLVLIGIILLLIYIRYRKTGSHILHNYYQVSPMKERSSSTNDQDEQRDDLTELYMSHC